MGQFLAAFSDEISKPVAHDGSEHVEYVPTQVVSEYFSQVFTYSVGKKVDGLVYPSAVVNGGKNLVVFPRHGVDTSAQQCQPFSVMKLGAARTGCVQYSLHSVV